MMEPENEGTIFIEPSIGTAFGNGWTQLWKNFWVLLLAGIITLAIIYGVSTLFSFIIMGGALTSSGLFDFEDPVTMFNGVGIALMIIFCLLSLAFSLFAANHLQFGLMNLFLPAARGDEVNIGDLFAGFRNYWPIVLIQLLYMAVTIAVGIVAALVVVFLSAIPIIGIFFMVVLMIAIFVAAIIIACKLAFVPYLLVDRKMDSIGAIRTSWNWTKGHAGKVFVLWLPLVGLAVVGYIIMLAIGFSVVGSGLSSSNDVGVFFGSFLIGGLVMLVAGGLMMMWIATSQASLFHAVSLQRDTFLYPDTYFNDPPAEIIE